MGKHLVQVIENLSLPAGSV